jgi:phosphoadenosine phosphosulfate reductase
MLTTKEVNLLDRQFADMPTAKVLEWAWGRFGTRAAIGTSFQGAGLVMMHLAKTSELNFPIFTLDTGLLFPETLELKKRLEDFFGWQIESLHPDLTVEQQEKAHGPELWKRDPDLCCTMRKVLPLQSRLADLDCWISGLRRDQGDTRIGIGIIEAYHFDQATGQDIVKLNPMANWSRTAVWRYIREQGIPYNPLHDQGFRSIGCWPCTANSEEGERAGRWVGFNKVECGIHTFLTKKESDYQI